MEPVWNADQGIALHDATEKTIISRKAAKSQRRILRLLPAQAQLSLTLLQESLAALHLGVRHWAFFQRSRFIFYPKNRGAGCPAF
jgi:hypothetical protein